MKHFIDPKIDCVFKALLGSEANSNLLIHFINALLAQELVEPLNWVQILNPYNEKEYLSDKLSIVDVKAKDAHERLYQIEIQLINYGSLKSRILYNWADIYSAQLASSQDYSLLKPTYSIWLLAEDLLKNSNPYAHHYKMRDESGQTFVDHGGIWLFELNKFNINRIEKDEQRWLKFFKDGEQLNDNELPDWMNTQEMKQAMNTLQLFSEKEQHYFAYQARQEYLREQRAIQQEQEQAKKERDIAEKQKAIAEKQKAAALRREKQANKEKEAALQREEQANREKEVALQREEQANREKEVALQREEQANREKDAAMQEKNAAMQREEQEKKEKETALQEIERLKALLAQH